MHIMIHACLKRLWYVTNFLVPSIIAQGVPPDDIRIWLDENGDGCLISCMKAFEECGRYPGGTWHLQDDVLVCRDFAKRCQEHDDGVVNGYVFRGFEDFEPQVGKVPSLFSWNSFPCVRIPNNLAGECAEWFWNDARYRESYHEWVESGKHDDGFWHDFYYELYPHGMVHNLKPNLVEHVDYLIGGSTVNEWRGYLCPAEYFEDHDLVEELKNKLARY